MIIFRFSISPTIGVASLLLLFSRQDKIFDILDTRILILYRTLYINILSIIVLNIEARQCNIKINLALSCGPASEVKTFMQRNVRGEYRMEMSFNIIQKDFLLHYYTVIGCIFSFVMDTYNWKRNENITSL